MLIDGDLVGRRSMTVGALLSRTSTVCVWQMIYGEYMALALATCLIGWTAACFQFDCARWMGRWAQSDIKIQCVLG